MALFVGLMSGTSLDGVDAALIDIDDTSRPRLVDALCLALPADLRASLLTLTQADRVDFATLGATESAFCDAQAEAVSRLLARQNLHPDEIVAIGSHGQTIEHAPDAASPFTYQLDNPSRLAELTGYQVVADFRRRDMAAGGQAAPLAPIFHQALFTDAERTRLVLNLGGIANLTRLAPSSRHAPVIGFDTGPANLLIDAWHARHRQAPIDENGRWAASGQVDETLLARLLDDAFFRRPPPKSTGREAFHLGWVERHLSGEEASANVQATLAEMTAVSVARAALPFVEADRTDLIVCGGGARNRHLMARLAHHLPAVALLRCEDFGWSADWLEAGAFGWLAWRRLRGLPGNLPEVTGARGPRVLGGIYAP
ncbi:anhydro-N-acetylmuramic acid kinase [Salinicola rhizosphaerae]|uniref:Anhydro-N-acetylmuramic acid kinase n=1 Tax=Salinicola rhizosphaerae TaxID=1443141 RepID=A0ABQ3DU93_9GAMM|nr:anhydro-N-acetylmuramic acid kinase [Salinicola rhizosphaerae]GHB15364.1 anhydro-N-acetylmuramic acid kinase [Salinicola rhizosphaerae]